MDIIGKAKFLGGRMKNLDEDTIAEIALEIVDSLVELKLIINCIDTNDSAEFDAQDKIREILSKHFSEIDEHETEIIKTGASILNISFEDAKKDYLLSPSIFKDKVVSENRRLKGLLQGELKFLE